MSEDKPKPKNKRKEVIKFVIKVLVSGVAIYFVYRKVDFAGIWDQIKNANIGWLLVAFLTFNVSKLISTFRLKSFLSAMGVEVSHRYNIKLYFIGAFYNLFLPGAVGGDGYKVFLLKDRFDQPTKKFISSMFLDRLSGVTVLFFLTGAMVLLVDIPEEWPWLIWVVIAGMILAFPTLYVVIWKGFNTFISAYWKTTGYSILTQVTQVLFAFFLLKALGVNAEEFAYLVLFMLAGVASVVPITLGGLGAREMVFSYAPDYLPVGGEVGVAFAFMVFATIALSSFAGFFLNWTRNK